MSNKFLTKLEEEYYQKKLKKEGAGAAESWLSLRRRCQTDLWFLAKDVFHKDLIERTHRPVTDFFVFKDPHKTIAEQDEIKNRLLLYPRGSFKSTIDIIDAIQWVICFPNIRVLFLPGDKALGKKFIKILNSYFVLGDEPTDFQLLFPEHCISEQDKYEEKFTTPARTDLSIGEPTVSYSSLESGNSGPHYDVVKPDDAVTNENSQTVASVLKVIENFYLSKKMLMPYGYCDGIGTRYHSLDLWGDMKDKAESFEKKFGTKTLKYLCVPVMWPKDEAKHKLEEEWTKEDVMMLFPELLSWEFCMLEKHNNIDSFNTQLMLRPKTTGAVKFTEDQIRAKTIPWDQIPQKTKSYIQWDLAYSAKSGRDYSVSATGFVDEQGRLFVVEVTHNRFGSGKETAFKIVDGIRCYHPELNRIEDSLGARWLETDMAAFAVEMHVDLSCLQWVPVDNSKGAKDNRTKGIEVLLNSGRLWFVNTISCYDDLVKEFTQTTPHDDIRDAIALLADVLPKKVEVTQQSKEAYEAAWDLLKRKLTHDMIYGEGEYAPKEATPVAIPETPPKVLDYFGFAQN